MSMKEKNKNNIISILKMSLKEKNKNDIISILEIRR